MFLQRLTKAILTSKNYGLTMIRYNKGHKSFMSLEDNMKDITFQEIASALGNENADLLDKFKESGKSFNLMELKDGLAKIIVSGYDKGSGEVAADTRVVLQNNHFKMFYNLVQLVERDITLLVANQFFSDLEKSDPTFKGARILQGNASSGVKAMRFAKELDPAYIEDITVMEKNRNFPEYFKLLTAYNGLDKSKFKIINSSAMDFYITKMAENIQKRQKEEEPEMYDFIDVEEYGTSIHAIRNAIHLIKDGGMISAMFTDMSALCGPNIIKCYNSYNKIRSKMSSLNENAIRVIYSAILDVAVSKGYSIEPVLTFQSDFYIKVFFKVNHNNIESQRALEKLSMVYQCTECPNYHVHNIAKVEQHLVENLQNGVLQLESSMELKVNNVNVPSHCNICDSSWKLNGPIWSEPLHNYQFLSSIIKKLNSTESGLVYSKNKQMYIQSVLKIKAYLETIMEEKDFDNQILGFNLNLITGFYKARHFPKFDHIKRALARSGYKVNRTILEKNVYKTDAPLYVIFDTVKGWRKLSDRFSQDSLSKRYTKDQGQNQNAEGEQQQNSRQQQQSQEDEEEDQNSPMARALRKRQIFYPKFAKLSFLEIEKLAEKIDDKSYLNTNQKKTKTVFYPNPTENWGPKKPFTVVYTHKFDKQDINEKNLKNKEHNKQSSSDEEK